MIEYNRDELVKDVNFITDITQLIFEGDYEKGGVDDNVFNGYVNGYYFIEQFYEGETPIDDLFVDAWEKAVKELREEDEDTCDMEFPAPDFPDPSHDTEYHGELMRMAIESLLHLLPEHLLRYFPGAVAYGFYSRRGKYY